MSMTFSMGKQKLPPKKGVVWV